MAITLSAINLQRAVTKALDDYRNTPAHYIADYVAPVVDAPERHGHMPKFQNSHMKLQDFRVSLQGKAHHVDIGITSTEYICEDRSAETPLTKRQMVSDSTGLVKANNLAVAVDEAMRLSRENEIAIALTALSANTPGTKWDVSGGSAPKDIATAQTAIHALINRLPEYGLATVDTGLTLRVLCGQANGRQTSDLPSLEETAKWLGLKGLRLAMAAYDSTKPLKSSTLATLFGTKRFWLFHRPPVMDSSLPAFMAQPRFKPLSMPRVYNTEQPEGFGIEVNDCSVLKTIDANAGYYFTSVLT